MWMSFIHAFFKQKISDPLRGQKDVRSTRAKKQKEKGETRRWERTERKKKSSGLGHGDKWNMENVKRILRKKERKRK